MVFEVAKFFFLPFGRGAMLSSERELACPATLPQIPIPACLVCLVIVNSKHSRPPLFVTWWPKWLGLPEATSGASGCSGGLEKRAPARHPCRLLHVPSSFSIRIHTALMGFPSGVWSKIRQRRNRSWAPRRSLESRSSATSELLATWCHKFQCSAIH